MRWIIILMLFAGCGGSSPTMPNDVDGDGYEMDVDCCDFDARAFPGQTLFFSEPNNDGSFDYNCDGTEELEFPSLHNCNDGEDLCENRPGGWKDYVPICRGLGHWVEKCGPEAWDVCIASSGRKIQTCR